MSVQVHAELVQVLAGNAVVAKTPSQGGFHCLTLAHAFMARAGLPVTLLSGVGVKLGDVLISSPGIGALAFVGGRSNGRAAATSLADTQAPPLPRAGGPQRLGHLGLHPVGRCSPSTSARASSTPSSAARPTRAIVVQRRLLPAFLEPYLPVLHDLRFGHPLAVAAPDDPLPELDFGPVISARKAGELSDQFDEALVGRALPLYPRLAR